MPKDASHLNRSSANLAETDAQMDAGPSTSASASSSSAAPLKRGDACLYCRKRRIRCSAHKPTCDHCKKLGKECVYDTGKPVSRVKQLEEKVAELQEMLMRQAGQGTSVQVQSQGQGQGQGQTQRQGSGDASSTGPIPVQRPGAQPVPQRVSSGGSSSDGFSFSSTTAFSFPGSVPTPSTNTGLPAQTSSNGNSWSQNDGLNGSGMLDSGSYHGRTTSLQSNPFTIPHTAMPVNMSAMAQTPRPAESFDFGTLDPSFMNLVSQFSAASTGDSSGTQNGQGQGMQVMQGQTSFTGQMGMGMPSIPEGSTQEDFGMIMASAMAGTGTGSFDWTGGQGGDGTGGAAGQGSGNGMNDLPSPRTMAAMDTPSILEAFSKASNGFFDSTGGASGSTDIFGQGQGQGQGQVQGQMQGLSSISNPNQATNSSQSLFASPGSSTSAGSMSHRGSDPAPSISGTDNRYSTNQNQQRAGGGMLDPRAASVSEFEEPSLPPSGAAADAQLKTTGAHFPGQDLVDGTSPLWRRDPVSIGNNSRSSFSIPQNGTGTSAEDMQREQIKANAAAFASANGWSTAYGYSPRTSARAGAGAGISTSGNVGRNGGDAWKRDPNMDGLPLVGGWFDAADLPAVARDHLLDIFFSKAKVFGQEFHVPRFYASLSLPPSRRPHPCLLYSMYTMAARSSDAPSIRSLESHFYSIALRQLEEAVARCDRILDATRAASMLAVYKYGLAKYHEGYMMTGMAARLGMSAGLHQISSTVFTPAKYPIDRRAELGSLMRQRAYILGPPADAIELGERIWAFWAIYVVDRCGAIAAQWPPAIPDALVTTPFPKPLYEYELNLVTERDNVSLDRVWSGAPILSNPYAHWANGFMWHIRALAILEVSSKLMYLPPEPGWEENLSAAGSAGGSPAAAQQQQQHQQQMFQMPMQTIDDFLRAQNFAAAAWGNGMRPGAGGFDGGGGMGMGMGMGGVGGGAGAGGGMGMGGMQGSGFDMDMDDPMAAYMSSGYNSYGSPANASSKSRAWTRTAKIRNPKAYEEVRMALVRLEADLPVEAQTNWEVWDGVVRVVVEPGSKKGGVSLHFCVGCAWMFMWDVYAFTAENTLAVNVARRMAATISLVLERNAFDELDTFIPMTWSFTVKILIREAKRLRAVDRGVEAAPIEAEIETILKALQVFGQRYNLASMQAMRADRFHRASEAETAQLAEEEEEEDETGQTSRMAWKDDSRR